MKKPLILVTVGTDYHPFDRLVDWVDGWMAVGGGQRARCLVQHGAARPPKECGGQEYLDHDELQHAMAEAAVVICHGGPATISEARRTGHLPLVVPRKPSRGEHVDDHQVRFARRLDHEGLVRCCDDENELHAALEQALADPASFRLSTSAEMARGDAPISESVRRTAALIDALIRAPSSRPIAVRSELDRWPAVDVVIPTRDRPELLREAIASVLGQEYQGDVHCVVVFDRSAPDWTLETEDPHRKVSVIRNERSPGLAGARNTGILHASGELVAFCDDDDTWLPGKLRAQIKALAGNPTALFACCGIIVSYDGASTDRTLALDRVELRHLLRSRLTELHPSTFVMRRDAVVDGFGLVTEQIPGSYAEDYEFLLRAAKHAPIVNVSEPYVRVLWHNKSHFASRWKTISAALSWLLRRYPEFHIERKGLARVSGQIAFAEAASGNRADALRWSARTMRAHPREMRAYLALAVASGVVNAEAVLRALHKRGRGI